MGVQEKTREQLKAECEALRSRLTELEAQKSGLEKERKELSDSKSYCSAILDAFDGLVYVCSEDHEIEFVNERIVRETGFDPVGEKCYKALHDLDDICPWCAGDRISQGETVQWEVLSPRDNRWYSVCYTPLRHGDGSISRLSVSRDITRLKRFEEELILARDELEQRVEERTADLSKAIELLRQEIGERQLTEDALRKSESKYKDLAELLPGIVFEVDAAGDFTLVNRSGLESLEYTWDELSQGMTIYDIVTPLDRETLTRNINRVLKGKKLSGTEYTFRKKGGVTFPALAYSSPIKRDDEIVGIRAVAIDITDLRQTQDSLWIKDSAIASSINAIAMADFEGLLTYINPSFLKMWGYDRVKDVIGRPVSEFWDIKDESEQPFHSVGHKGSWIGELKAWRRNGTVFDVQLSATLVTDKTGQPICIMASFLDITERKRLGEALRSSEERFRAVFEGAADYIFMKDKSLRYTHVNPAVEKLLDMPTAQIVGRKAEDVFGKEAGKRITEVNLRVLRGESIEEEHTRPVKGENLTFHEVTVPLYSPEREIVGTCTISRNITELRKTRPVPHIRVRDYPSKAMRETLQQAHHAATKDSIILLVGESGSGKDYVAQWIHRNSSRAGGPFFAINCAALPHELAESELFGHEAGAFTGARARKRGLLELAEGGTILLNEIGELQLALQAKLLTFLDTRSFMRVGGEKSIHINARLIAATHRNLREEVAAGSFLPTLFYRLNVFSIEVPPLRRRIEDISILCEEIMTELASEMQMTELPIIDTQSREALLQYPWPGNVRELRNVLERALMLWDEGPFRLQIPSMETPAENWYYKVLFPSSHLNLHTVTEDVKAALCIEALRRTGGNKKEAARILGISRYSFYRYLTSSGIECDHHTRAS